MPNDSTLIKGVSTWLQIRDEEESKDGLHFDALLQADIASIASISSNSIAYTDDRQREVGNFLSVAEQMDSELDMLEGKLNDVKILQSKIISSPDHDEGMLHI